MNNFVFSKFPLTYSALVFEITNQCNAKCKMCYQASGPGGSDNFGKGEIPIEIVRTVLSDAKNIQSLGSRVHFSGGEIFLNTDKCLVAFTEAKNCGFLEISATTNGFWAKDLRKAKTFANEFRRAGLTRLEISWDFWHGEFISPDCINNSIIACHEVGIEIVLRMLSSKSHSAKNALDLLDDNLFKYVDEIVFCPTMPIGRASETITTQDVLYSGNLDYSCHHMLNLTVNAFGDVFPCCSGIDQNGNLKFGNVYDEPISEVTKWMNESLLLRALVFLGPGSFIPILEDAGIHIGNEFSTICDVCWSIFSNEKKARIIEEYFFAHEKKRLLYALDTN